MEKILTEIRENEKKFMEQQLLLTAADLLAERGFIDNGERNSIKRSLAYEEVYG